MTLWIDLDEEWLPVVGGFDYEVSSHGRVRRTTAAANTYAGRILRASRDPDGYATVTLSRGGTTYGFRVSRLVCEAFNGPPPDCLSEARHLDDVPAHDYPGNLAWGTSLDNACDREINGHTARGERHSSALFTDAEIASVRERHALAKASAIAAGRRYVPRGFVADLAAEMGIGRKVLSNILSGAGY